MTPVGFETKISSGEWPQTYALDHAATGTGTAKFIIIIIIIIDFLTFVIPNMSYIQQTHSVASLMTCGNGGKQTPFLGFSL